jgi:hypothetical protein
MNRRELARGACALMIARSLPTDGVGSMFQQPLRAPKALAQKTVAGVRIVDSAAAKRATDLARESSPEFLFNHAMRTYLFGALTGQSQALRFDYELLYLASILHDIGLTEKFMGSLPFEIQGAQAASDFLKQQGLSESQREVVWDGIALHSSIVGDFKRPEVSLVGAGAGCDVVGPDFKQVNRQQVDEVVRAFPRLNFKTEFVKTCATVVRRYPAVAHNGFMRDIRDRYVPDFRDRNICDKIAESSFDQ